MKNRLSPLHSIRKKCLECSGYSKLEIELCPMKDCSLYEFRFGKNPQRKGIGGGIQKHLLAKQLTT